MKNSSFIMGNISLLLMWIGIHTIIVAGLYRLDSFQVLMVAKPMLIRVLTLILSFSGLIGFLKLTSELEEF